jgi:hypothetical protein
MPISQIIIPFITGLLGYVIAVFVERFKSRNVAIHFSILYNNIGTTSQIPHWGKIEVLHDGRPTQHLNFVTIEIQNDSSRNFTNMNINAFAEGESQFLRHSGIYNGTKTAILLESGFWNHFVKVGKENETDLNLRKLNPNHVTPQPLLNDINYVTKNRVFHLPVFNRKSSVTLNLLTENFKGQQPEVVVSVLHEGVKLVRKEDKVTETKKISKIILVLSCFVYAIGLLLLFIHYKNDTDVLIWSGILGISYGAIAWLIISIFRFIKKIFS